MDRSAYPTMASVARWSWNMVGIAAAAWVLLQLLEAGRSVVIPFLVGLLIAALVEPLARLLRRWLPAYAAAGIAMLSLLGLVAVISWASGAQLSNGVRALFDELPSLIQRLEAWVVDSGLGIGGDQIENVLERAQAWVTDNSGQIASQALAFSNSAVSLVTATALALITAFFVLGDGRTIWNWIVNLLPERFHQRTQNAGDGAWGALQAYIRTQVLVAAVDAVGIGLGALLLGLPFVGPIVLIVFLSAFIPVVGAILSGALAVLIALADGGLTPALIMAGVVLAVQQLEGNVLQPVLMGRAVSIHPYAVLIGVSLGSFLLGITGAFLAVPLMAMGKTAIERWGDPIEPEPVPVGPDDPDDGSESTARTEE
ncbi:AI-2E family transporter [Nocardioides rotundus]|uniref:AI-2E family transporter n=1 Tax=Nocardioides rotundus TaxID=1774216 RepID=UPI001CC0C500|nr:AI-2E family transporter [Nocardioides rotundus]UAL29129.1 AI-2E family transporter [Nocardioides rotundus]